MQLRLIGNEQFKIRTVERGGVEKIILLTSMFFLSCFTIGKHTHC